MLSWFYFRRKEEHKENQIEIIPPNPDPPVRTSPWQFYSKNIPKADPSTFFEPFDNGNIFDKIDKVLLTNCTRASEHRQSTVPAYALCGMGGLGKTRAAAEYVWSRQDDFKAVFWVAAGDKEVLIRDFARIAIDVGLVRTFSHDPLTSCEKVKNWLANPDLEDDRSRSSKKMARWLLVFDNANHYEILKDFWPRSGPGAILLTSRNPQIDSSFCTVNHDRPLMPLDDWAAAWLLNSLRPDHWKAFEAFGDSDPIVKRLGGVPLLIAYTANLISESRLPCVECKVFYKNRGLDEISFGDQSEADHLTVSRVLGLDELHISSLTLLFLIAMLNPDGVPESLLREADPSDFPADFPKTDHDYSRARTQLIQCSLINYRDSGHIWILPIVRDLAREKLGEVGRAEFFTAAIKIVSKAWPFVAIQDRYTTKRNAKCELISTTADHLKQTYHDVAGSESFTLHSSSAQLFNEIGWYCFEEGFQEEAREWFEMVKDICNDLADKDDPNVASTIRVVHYNLGATFGETRDAESFHKYIRLWMSMLLERKDGEGQPIHDFELGQAYNELGAAHIMMGCPDLAAESLTKSIEVLQSLPDYHFTWSAWPTVNLGLLYWLCGRYEEAEKLLLEILKKFETAYGIDDVVSCRTGKILSALGNVCISQQRFDDGFKYHERCLKQYRATLGKRNHWIGDACYRLADHHYRRGEYEEAEIFIYEALEIFCGREDEPSAHLGPRPRYPPEYARATCKHAQIQRGMGYGRVAGFAFGEACFLFMESEAGRVDSRTLRPRYQADFDNIVAFWSR